MLIDESPVKPTKMHTGGARFRKFLVSPPRPLSGAPVDPSELLAGLTGHYKAERACFMAMANPEMANVVKIAQQTLNKETSDVGFFEFCRSLPGADKEIQWLPRVAVDAEISRLKNEIKNTYRSGIRETIRIAFCDLGDFYFACGDLDLALESYETAQQHASSPESALESALLCTKCAIYLKPFIAVKESVSKILKEVKPTKKQQAAQICLIMAQCALMHGRFDVAFEYFRQETYPIDTQVVAETGICSCSNVALYGTLCALATCSDICDFTAFIFGSRFSVFLEAEPRAQHLASLFCKSKYGAVLAQLSITEPLLRLDFVLHYQLPRLVCVIRGHSIAMFLSPYSAVPLKTIADEFCLPVDKFEDILFALIESRVLHAQIDAERSIIYSTCRDMRTETLDCLYSFGHGILVSVNNCSLQLDMMRKRIPIDQ